MRLSKSLGLLLLAIWLMLYGVVSAPFLRISFDYSAHVLSLLAIATGVVLLLHRS